MNDNIVKLFAVVKKSTLPQAEAIVSALEWFQTAVPVDERETALRYLRLDVDSRKRGEQKNPRKKKGE